MNNKHIFKWWFFTKLNRFFSRIFNMVPIRPFAWLMLWSMKQSSKAFSEDIQELHRQVDEMQQPKKD